MNVTDILRGDSEGHELRGRRDQQGAERTDRRTQEVKTPYDDIIRLPHHVSQNHPQMPLRDRAAQFAPFAALTGYEAAVGETARLTAERRELDAQEAEELDCRLAATAILKRVISIAGETENDVQWNTKILHLKRCDFCEYLKIK